MLFVPPCESSDEWHGAVSTAGKLRCSVGVVTGLRDGSGGISLPETTYLIIKVPLKELSRVGSVKPFARLHKIIQTTEWSCKTFLKEMQKLYMTGRDHNGGRAHDLQGQVWLSG